MAMYFVNGSGTNTPPYSSSASGATNFTNLVGGVTLVDDDIIEVVDGTEIVNSAALVALTADVTIRSWSSNTGTPVVRAPLSDPLFTLAGPNYTIQNLHMFKTGPDAVGPIIRFDGNGAASEITGNQFSVSNQTNSTAVGIDSQDKTFSGTLTIRNNKFRRLVKGVNVGIASLTIAAKANFYARMRSTPKVFWPPVV